MTDEKVDTRDMDECLEEECPNSATSTQMDTSHQKPEEQLEFRFSCISEYFSETKDFCCFHCEQNFPENAFFAHLSLQCNERENYMFAMCGVEHRRHLNAQIDENPLLSSIINHNNDDNNNRIAIVKEYGIHWPKSMTQTEIEAFQKLQQQQQQQEPMEWFRTVINYDKLDNGDIKCRMCTKQFPNSSRYWYHVKIYSTVKDDHGGLFVGVCAATTTDQVIMKCDDEQQQQYLLVVRYENVPSVKHDNNKEYDRIPSSEPNSDLTVQIKKDEQQQKSVHKIKIENENKDELNVAKDDFKVSTELMDDDDSVQWQDDYQNYTKSNDETNKKFKLSGLATQKKKSIESIEQTKDYSSSVSTFSSSNPSTSNGQKRKASNDDDDDDDEIPNKTNNIAPTTTIPAGFYYCPVSACDFQEMAFKSLHLLNNHIIGYHNLDPFITFDQNCYKANLIYSDDYDPSTQTDTQQQQPQPPPQKLVQIRFSFNWKVLETGDYYCSACEQTYQLNAFWPHLKLMGADHAEFETILTIASCASNVDDQKLNWDQLEVETDQRCVQPNYDKLNNGDRICRVCLANFPNCETYWDHLKLGSSLVATDCTFVFAACSDQMMMNYDNEQVRMDASVRDKNDNNNDDDRIPNSNSDLTLMETDKQQHQQLEETNGIENESKDGLDNSIVAGKVVFDPSIELDDDSVQCLDDLNYQHKSNNETNNKKFKLSSSELTTQKKSVLSVKPTAADFSSFSSNPSTSNGLKRQEAVDEIFNNKSNNIAPTTGFYNCPEPACDSTEKAFESMHLLNYHLIAHHKRKPFICFVQNCYKTYNLNDSLSYHTKMDHRVLPNKYQCFVCFDKFSSQKEAFDHWKSSHLTGCKLMRCKMDKCARVFNTTRELLDHQSVAHCHSESKHFQCPHDGCTEKFATTQELIQHKVKCGHTENSTPNVKMPIRKDKHFGLSSAEKKQLKLIIKGYSDPKMFISRKS